MAGEVKEYPIQLPNIPSAAVYYFTTDSGINYEVRFGRKQDNVLHATIVFGVTNEEFEGEEYSVTNKGELYRVMSTIVKISQIFMQEHPKITCYEFTGISEEDEKEKAQSVRNRLYQRYLPLIFTDGNWEFSFRGNTCIASRKK